MPSAPGPSSPPGDRSARPRHVGPPGRAAPCRPKPGGPEARRPAPHLAARGRSRHAASRWWRRAAVARSGRGRPRSSGVGRAVGPTPGRRGAVLLHPETGPPFRVFLLPCTAGPPGPIPRAPVGPVRCADPGLGTWWFKNKGQASGCGRAETCPAPPRRAAVEEKGTKGIPRARGPRRKGWPRSLPERQGL